VRPKANI